MNKEFCSIQPGQKIKESMDENVVKTLINNYFRLWKNPNYQLGEIESKGDKFEARALAVSGFPVDRIFVVDKHTGWVQFARTE